MINFIITTGIVLVILFLTFLGFAMLSIFLLRLLELTGEVDDE